MKILNVYLVRSKSVMFDEKKIIASLLNPGAETFSRFKHELCYAFGCVLRCQWRPNKISFTRNIHFARHVVGHTEQTRLTKFRWQRLQLRSYVRLIWMHNEPYIKTTLCFCSLHKYQSMFCACERRPTCPINADAHDCAHRIRYKTTTVVRPNSTQVFSTNFHDLKKSEK